MVYIGQRQQIGRVISFSHPSGSDRSCFEKHSPHLLHHRLCWKRTRRPPRNHWAIKYRNASLDKVVSQPLQHHPPPMDALRAGSARSRGGGQPLHPTAAGSGCGESPAAPQHQGQSQRFDRELPRELQSCQGKRNGMRLHGLMWVYSTFLPVLVFRNRTAPWTYTWGRWETLSLFCAIQNSRDKPAEVAASSESVPRQERKPYLGI